MIINYVAIKDPEFKGMDTFRDRYTRIETGTFNEHLRLIKEAIAKDKPFDAVGITFYSVPDARGMRFMRVTENAETDNYYILSDFRWEWVV